VIRMRKEYISQKIVKTHMLSFSRSASRLDWMGMRRANSNRYQFISLEAIS